MCLSKASQLVKTNYIQFIFHSTGTDVKKNRWTVVYNVFRKPYEVFH